MMLPRQLVLISHCRPCQKATDTTTVSRLRPLQRQVVVGPQHEFKVLENPQKDIMARLTALFGSVFACLVLATSAAPGNFFF